MKSMGLEQFNTHESDARMMRTPKGARVAYNVQAAVDAEYCPILHHEVTQDGDDRKRLEPFAKATKAELGQAALTVTADMGYSNGQQFQACEEASITATCRQTEPRTQAERHYSSARTLPTRLNRIGTMCLLLFR